MVRLENSYRELPAALWAEAMPTPVRHPQLVLFNETLAAELGLAQLDEGEAAQVFAGNVLPVGSRPLAQAYAGHQFGHSTMLGDGRAVLLGERLTPHGKRVDIQLKGAGRTSFSRGGDGRAALGPMLREYVVSESLHALGVPTTRSLAVVTTGERVQREQPLLGAIVTRVASSHLRVGTFQYASWHHDKTLLPALLDYAIERHYPHLKQAQNPALAFLDNVMNAQITLVVHWMRVGFIHGVLNTDNVTISGEAIDFGPCAFMDEYEPSTVFSSIDRQGRYAFNRQPAITLWNLERLAEAVLPLIDDDINQAVAVATDVLQQFEGRFSKQWLSMMKGKLGLIGSAEGDEQLIDDWLQLLQQHRLDYTNAHRALTYHKPPFDSDDMTAWYKRWQQRVGANLAAATQLMQQHNPAIIPRNHLVNQALEAAQAGNMQPFDQLLSALVLPYVARDEGGKFTMPPTSDERVTQTFCGT